MMFYTYASPPQLHLMHCCPCNPLASCPKLLLACWDETLEFDGCARAIVCTSISVVIPAGLAGGFLAQCSSLHIPLTLVVVAVSLEHLQHPLAEHLCILVLQSSQSNDKITLLQEAELRLTACRIKSQSMPTVNDGLYASCGNAAHLQFEPYIATLSQ